MKDLNGSIYLWNSELKIEFITPEFGKGTDKAITIKNLNIKAIPLRFVNLLLEKPMSVDYNGMKVLIPNPENFMIHKLLVSARRKKEEKKEKDFTQAILTYSIVDKKRLHSLYNELPKAWQKKILNILNEGKEEFVLFEKEIEEILVTLQK